MNVFTLIVAILRARRCTVDDAGLSGMGEFSHERYSYKIFIHSMICLGQFLIYFALLVAIDIWKLPLFGRGAKTKSTRAKRTTTWPTNDDG